MKRLVGGLVLLSLTKISLDVTAGEVAITDKEVLDQLVNLRGFIDEQRDFTKASKGLKPVLVQYRSSASKIDGIVQCNLSFNTDALHLSIGGCSLQADGTTISILINVVFEYTEYVGYTIKSATLTCSDTKVKVADVKNIDGAIIEQLKCGDIVIKEDASGEHAYVVTFKSETGMCLTYTDASCVETQSYDKDGDDWVYNSEDKVLLNKLEDITDKDGNNRFIEGNVNLFENVPAGVTKTYGKWSLSGSHLLIVLGLNIANATEIGSGQLIARLNDLPQWIQDKIVVLFGSNNVYRENFNLWASDASKQSPEFALRKDTTYGIYITMTSLTATSDRDGRIQFDLLIDNE